MGMDFHRTCVLRMKSSLTFVTHFAAGIPKFFRWIAERFPLTLSNLTADVQQVEIDNLYLDMNGIIHNCTHANQSRTTATEEQMVYHAFAYIERLVRIAKPSQLLFMAIDGVLQSVTITERDPCFSRTWLNAVPPFHMKSFKYAGVAPRAKMNQQRSRRFKAGKEREEVSGSQ